METNISCIFISYNTQDLKNGNEEIESNALVLSKIGKIALKTYISHRSFEPISVKITS